MSANRPESWNRLSDLSRIPDDGSGAGVHSVQDFWLVVVTQAADHVKDR